MVQQLTIDDIRNSRDTALDALGVSVTTIGDEIAQTTTTGPYLDQLTRRNTDLMNERAAIRAAATDAVLALSSVIAAAGTLNTLSTQMKTAAQALPAATNVLTGTAPILSFGQQFTNEIASAQK